MIYVIVGPTASGKSALALQFAESIGGHIINGDAFQVYEKLNIGTAKPTQEEREKVPHHLYDFIPLTRNYNVRDYQIDLREVIDTLSKKNVPMVIVGGTGLYMRAGLYDYEFKDGASSDMSRFEKWSNEELFAYLISIDPISANKTHANNRKRVLRAIEIFESTGETKSSIEARQQHHLLYETTFIGLDIDRDTLYKRINTRVEKMFTQGLYEEALHLFSQYDHNAYGFQAIGYKEIHEGVHQGQTLEAIQEVIQQNTRNYAKRQITFFKHQLPVQWFHSQEDALQYLWKIHKEKNG